MATTSTDPVIRQLRQAALRQEAAGWTDGQLLVCFLDQKDEEAFAALVRRHGPMVFSVCRRVVGNHHDAEDAFQATFLVLARKASSVKPRERVANWLHGVALRTALKAKAQTAKRRARETPLTETPELEAAPPDRWQELQPLLDQQLNALPENYRLPILLCDLEGRTIKQVAQQLGWPQGTLAGRLARGRKLLAKRLASRGAVLSAGPLAAVAVPSSVISSTAKAASRIATGQATVAGLVPARVAVLTEGVLKTMFLMKLERAAAVTVALVVLAGIGAGLLASRTAAGQQSAGKQAEAPALPKQAARSDKDRLQGTWLAISCACNGEDRMQPWMKDNALLVIKETDGKLSCQTVFKDKAKVLELFGEGMEKWTQGALKLDARTKPPTLDFTGAQGNGTYLGIYKLDGDTLTWCQSKVLTPAASAPGSERPADFSTKRGDGRTLTVYKRQQEAAPLAATVNGEVILTEEVYAAAYLSLPDAPDLTAFARALRIKAVWTKTLERVIEREVIVQAAYTHLANGHAEVPEKLQEAAATEFVRQWLEPVRKSTGLKDDEQLSAYLRARGTSLDAVYRQWERDFIAEQYLRSRLSRGPDQAASPPSGSEDARNERIRLISQLKQHAVIECGGGR